MAYGHIKDITECPPGLVDRLKHYFLTYKQLPRRRRAASRSLTFTNERNPSK